MQQSSSGTYLIPFPRFSCIGAPPMMMSLQGVSQTPFAVPALELSPLPGLESCCSYLPWMSEASTSLSGTHLRQHQHASDSKGLRVHVWRRCLPIVEGRGPGYRCASGPQLTSRVHTGSLMHCM